MKRPFRILCIRLLNSEDTMHILPQIIEKYQANDGIGIQSRPVNLKDGLVGSYLIKVFMEDSI